MRISHYRSVVVAAGLLLWLVGFVPVFGIHQKRADWQIRVPEVPQNKEMQAAGVNTLSIPVGPTGIQAIITQENPACFTVVYVYRNSPASGKVKAGDLICGANGRRLSKPHVFGSKMVVGNRNPGMEGPLTEMAPLIEAAQGSDGKLALMVHPGGNTKVTETVTIQIEPVGRFSDTYPYNCPRSDKLVTQLCAIIARDLADRNHRPHIRTPMLLALMASGEKKYESTIKKAAHSGKDQGASLLGPGFPSWGNGYQGVFLGEYYLKTKDRAVLPRIAALNNYYTHGMALESGGFSHRARPTIVQRVAGGGPVGYGSMAAPGGLAMLAMSLFRAAGAPYAEFAHERIHRAYLKTATEAGVNVGYGFGAVEHIHILVEDPKQGQSGKGVGFRCPTGMEGITDYTIKGVGLWAAGPGGDSVFQWMWNDTAWLEKERDTNLVEEWGGNQRLVIRNQVPQEPTKPYNTTRGVGGAQAATGLGALAHLIGNSDRKSWEYLGKHAANSSALGPKQWFQGHASGGMHQLWQALAAARADEKNFRAFMDYNKWWFIMMQTHAGSYMVCPNRDRADQDASYGQYTMATANAALVLALSRRQLQITGADGPASGYAPDSSFGTSTAPTRNAAQPFARPERPALRQARTLSADKLAILDRALMRTLSTLSESGGLTPVPLSMAFTSRRVLLKSVSSEGVLEFQLAEGSDVAEIAWSSMSHADRALLAVLVAHLRKDSTDAQAMAGVYLETLAQVEQADAYYAEADEASRRKLQSLFD
ncbi:MAG: DUF6288 domain-containing protein [Kiritimatiellia bacterium]